MKNLLTIIFLFVSILCFGQGFNIRLNIGYGKYNLNDIRSLQTDLAIYNGNLQLQEVDQFPGYLNYSGAFEYIINTKNLIGLNGGYYSTGGRNSLMDYSGEYKLDMLLSGYEIGLNYSNIFHSQGKFNMYARLKIGLILTRLDIDESLLIYQVDAFSSNSVFNSNVFFGEPDLGISYNLSSKYAIDFSAGYQISLDSEMHLSGNKDAKLILNNGTSVHSDWSGLRISLGAVYLF